MHIHTICLVQCTFRVAIRKSSTLPRRSCLARSARSRSRSIVVIFNEHRAFCIIPDSGNRYGHSFIYNNNLLIVNIRNLSTTVIAMKNEKEREYESMYSTIVYVFLSIHTTQSVSETIHSLEIAAAMCMKYDNRRRIQRTMFSHNIWNATAPQNQFF